MFADRLNNQQRQAVFDLAVMLAYADRELASEEEQYLRNFSEAFGIEYNLDKSDLKVDDLLKVFKNKHDRIILLQELIKLSYKDGHFGQEEQENVFTIAQKLGLNEPELFMRIEKWVREGFNWVYEGEDMLDDA
ncbi:MAG: TerB family tellurite resistance protein [Hydrogenovibrio sp.]|uniref:TerB family tellurite resistance protein n=1 Tax=Hydrogenovibrio sp. TaxID=2065821 RepID=UPI00286FDF8F|nr:TerB family tellurite resistance protein [Hydrogenovibrio sp.]MDR9498949.1 TerB family tellurite resistance protein [Hydrogenovibrio sp.]